MENPNQLLTEKQVCELTGLRPQTLQKRRREGQEPRFVRLSSRCVRYRQGDVLDWINAHTVGSTEEAKK